MYTINTMCLLAIGITMVLTIIYCIIVQSVFFNNSSYNSSYNNSYNSSHDNNLLDRNLVLVVQDKYNQEKSYLIDVDELYGIDINNSSYTFYTNALLKNDKYNMISILTLDTYEAQFLMKIRNNYRDRTFSYYDIKITITN